MSKIAIVFPGIGYHTDKPLLYYGRKLAAELGYRVIEVSYSGFESGIKGDPEKMRRAFEHALDQSIKILSEYSFSFTDDLVIISKSVGTVVSGAWQKKEGIHAKNIYFTPVEATFEFINADSGIVFHGTADPWVETEVVLENCNHLHLPLFLTEDANHSMEKESTFIDLCNMQSIMQHCQSYLLGMDMWAYADNENIKKVVEKNPDTVIREQWEIIKYNLTRLSYEPYIDDQLEIDEVWRVSEEVCAYLKENDISSELKMSLIRTFVENLFFDEFGCYDATWNFANALCKNREDDLYFAGCLWKNGGFFRKYAAEIYLRHGREDKYIEYLMQSLAKDTAAYEKAIRYFQSTGKREMAVEVAKIGLEKCKHDQTMIYCTLVEDALMRDDQKRVQELRASARRKRRVNQIKVEELIEHYSEK